MTSEFASSPVDRDWPARSWEDWPAQDLPDLQATETLGHRIAGALGPGDAVMLSGPLGAGKSALARALIRARLGDPEAEIPSPTFTLVNVYEAPGGQIWHADLYRLGDPGEWAELGLEEAEAALLLVEWAERLGPAAPARRLEITLTPTPQDGRRAEIRPIGPGWERVGAALGIGA
ncbi:MAG: tRNA (adenosine(37)-N6)-threonylcarbamoyltransferase complex ATPase subunit type 1 TsaE [Paracoccaceae bacterium]